jgi:hypothetical protein
MRPQKYHLLLLFFLGLLLLGLARTEFLTVYSHARLLCFSCMGLQ